MSDTFTDEDLGVDLESLLGETPPEECAHIIERMNGLGAGALLAAAVEFGWEVTALCGWKWTPVGAPPDNMPVCRRCVDEWQRRSAAQ